MGGERVGQRARGIKGRGEGRGEDGQAGQGAWEGRRAGAINEALTCSDTNTARQGNVCDARPISPRDRVHQVLGRARAQRHARRRLPPRGRGTGSARRPLIERIVNPPESLPSPGKSISAALENIVQRHHALGPSRKITVTRDRNTGDWIASGHCADRSKWMGYKSVSFTVHIKKKKKGHCRKLRTEQSY